MTDIVSRDEYQRGVHSLILIILMMRDVNQSASPQQYHNIAINFIFRKHKYLKIFIINPCRYYLYQLLVFKLMRL